MWVMWRCRSPYYSHLILTITELLITASLFFLLGGGFLFFPSAEKKEVRRNSNTEKKYSKEMTLCVCTRVCVCVGCTSEWCVPVCSVCRWLD